MKIGIVTFQRADNYGALLQCYALWKVLQGYCPDTEVIDYRNPIIEKVYTQYKKLHRPLYRYLKTNAKAFLMRRIYRRRKAGFTQLRGRINFSQPYTREEVLAALPGYSLVFAGSDQIFNPGITLELDDVYFLRAKGDFRRVTYAASVGDLSNPYVQGEEFVERLSAFDRLSFREGNLTEYAVKKGLDAVQVVDPTFLLSREEWDAALRDVEMHASSPYLLLYYVEYNEDMVLAAESLARKLGLVIYSFDRRWKKAFTPERRLYHYCDDAGPLAFVKLIRDAACVVTNSFHGTAFSAIYRKDVYLFRHSTTGARVVTLAEMCGISNRIFSTFDEFNTRQMAENDVRYNEERIAKAIHSSREYIEEVLKLEKG